MPKGDATIELPQKRTGRLLAWLDRYNLWRLIIAGLLSYASIVLIFSVIEYVCHILGHDLIFNNYSVGITFFDILYFNLSTILTSSFGDFRPVLFWGRLFSILEVFIGVGLFSALVAVIIVKALLPPRNSVVFSKYAYYCTDVDPQRFLIIFVNTSYTNLGNVEISSYFKLGGDWRIRPSDTAPFITQSVQTFYIGAYSESEVVRLLRDGDCLRVGMAGGLGFTSFSTSVQYNTDEILVIPDRSELVRFFLPLWNPNFNDPEFKRMFHYRPEGALTLRSYVEVVRTRPTPE